MIRDVSVVLMTIVLLCGVACVPIQRALLLPLPLLMAGERLILPTGRGSPRPTSSLQRVELACAICSLLYEHVRSCPTAVKDLPFGCLVCSLPEMHALVAVSVHPVREKSICITIRDLLTYVCLEILRIPSSLLISMDTARVCLAFFPSCFDDRTFFIVIYSFLCLVFIRVNCLLHTSVPFLYQESESFAPCLELVAGLDDDSVSF